MGMIYVDADACPVREEAIRVAERNGMTVTFVSNGGLRPSKHPLVRIIVVEDGPDVADKWIADRAKSGDICVTADVPLAARCVEAGAHVIGHDGDPFTPANIGNRLATRDLMADLKRLHLSDGALRHRAELAHRCLFTGELIGRQPGRPQRRRNRLAVGVRP